MSPGRVNIKPATVVVLLAALAVAALFIWETRILTPIAIDDAYITFSYSKNLATGHGPVYGHGERVEGYSNFLWMVAVAIGLLVSPRGADPLLVARATAIPFVALLGFATYRLARARASRPLAIAVLVVLALAADMGTAFLMGLETLPAMAFLMLGFWLYVRSIEAPVGVGDLRRRRRLRAREPTLGRAGVRRRRALAHRRFHSAGVHPRLRALPAAVAPRRHRPRLRRLGRARRAGLRALVPLALALLRAAAADDLLRQGADPQAPAPPRLGVRARRDEANGSLALAPLALLALAARKRIAALLLLAFVALHLAYVVRAGGDWMPYGRFLLPLAAGGAGAGGVGRPVDRRRAPSLARARVAGVVCYCRWPRWRSSCTGPSGTSPPSRCN